MEILQVKGEGLGCKYLKDRRRTYLQNLRKCQNLQNPHFPSPLSFSPLSLSHSNPSILSFQALVGQTQGKASHIFFFLDSSPFAPWRRRFGSLEKPLKYLGKPCIFSPSFLVKTHFGANGLPTPFLTCKLLNGYPWVLIACICEF